MVLYQERGMNDELYVQLLEAMAEADNSKRDAFDESIRRRKAEKDAIEAKRRVNSSPCLHIPYLIFFPCLYVFPSGLLSIRNVIQ